MHKKHTTLLAFLLLFIAAIAARADKIDDYVKAEMHWYGREYYENSPLTDPSVPATGEMR